MLALRSTARRALACEQEAAELQVQLDRLVRRLTPELLNAHRDSSSDSMGSGDFYPEERPIHEVAVSDLWVDEHPVTNAQFRRFVKATGHLTVAEQAPDAADFLVRQPLIWCPAL